MTLFHFSQTFAIFAVQFRTTMTNFEHRLAELYPEQRDQIKSKAHEIHAAVNQTYDKVYPYSIHLDMVADNVAKYADELSIADADLLPIWFGALFHDSMEDARLTYNNVLSVARQFMPEDKAVLAAEIVYALTNEKGRTREERANDKYYSGIRSTPYAPMIKLADRLANFGYSLTKQQNHSHDMLATYSREMPHFIEAITSEHADSDSRYALPGKMLKAINDLMDKSLLVNGAENRD